MKQLIVVIFFNSILIVFNIFCADTSAKQKDDTDYKAIVQAIFPDEKIVIQEEERNNIKQTVMRINKEWCVDYRQSLGWHIKTCVVRTEENGDKIHFVAISLDPDINDPYYPMEAKIIVAVLRETDRIFELLYKSDVPLKEGVVERGGSYDLKSFEMLEMIKRTMVVIEYQYTDSISVPRGKYIVTNIIDFDDNHKPKVVWYELTEYGKSFSGEGKHMKIAYRVVKDKEGYEQLFIEKTTVEKYARVWDGSEFVDPRYYPPEPFSKRIERKKKEEEEKQKE
jgi:hypothetical protein